MSGIRSHSFLYYTGNYYFKHNYRSLKGNVPVHCDQEGKEGHLVEASKSAQLTQVHEKPKVAIPYDLEIHQI